VTVRSTTVTVWGEEAFSESPPQPLNIRPPHTSMSRTKRIDTPLGQLKDTIAREIPLVKARIRRPCGGPGPALRHAVDHVPVLLTHDAKAET
jgi:hypothetical protein